MTTVKLLVLGDKPRTSFKVKRVDFLRMKILLVLGMIVVTAQARIITGTAGYTSTAEGLWLVRSSVHCSSLVRIGHAHAPCLKHEDVGDSFSQIERHRHAA